MAWEPRSSRAPPGTTQDLALWFGSIEYTSGFGMQPPAVSGEGLDRVDIVLNADGLRAFDEEYADARDYLLEGVRVRVLPLERVIASKPASNRAKDLAQLPHLEADSGTRLRVVQRQS